LKKVSKVIHCTCVFLKDFLLNKDIALPADENEEDMGYLLYNYITEYRKRGTEQIYFPKGTNGSQIDGELLRAIGYEELDDINLALLENTKVGWCIGESSPTWKGTEGCTNLIKGYEYTKEVVDLNKYPIVNPTKVSIVTDNTISTDAIKVSGHTQTNLETGISAEYPYNSSKMILIDPRLDYEISVRVKREGVGSDYLNFGCQAFTTDLGWSPLLSVTNGSTSNSFFLTGENNRLDIEGKYYWLRGIIFNKNKGLHPTLNLNFRNSQALYFDSSAKYIVPTVISLSGTNASNLYIYDLKVRVLNLPFSQGQLGIKNIITGYVENKGELGWDKLTEFIQTKLIPYNSFLKIKEII